MTMEDEMMMTQIGSIDEFMEMFDIEMEEEEAEVTEAPGNPDVSETDGGDFGIRGRFGSDSSEPREY